MGPSGGRRPRSRGRAQLSVLVVLAVAVLAAGCQVGAPGRSTSGSGAVTTAQPLTWAELTLPDGVEPVTVVPADDALVIGGFATDRPRPVMFIVRDQRLTPIQVEPHSPYAFVARWVSIAVADGHLVAVGGARGGAHANVRWTVWQGSATGRTPQLVEHPQPFGVFGGWGAGDLTGVAFAGAEPVIAGAWASERTGNDVSLWRASEDRWARQDSTGTPLGSTPTALNGARFIATTGQGLALAGSVTDLGGGSVVSVPALWFASGPQGPWTLVRLPAAQSIAEAHSARCEQSRCLVVGADGDALAVWDVQGSTPTRLTTPQVVLADKQVVPPPVGIAGSSYIALPGLVLEGTSRGWDERTGPPGAPMAAAAVGDVLYLVTRQGDGPNRLWSARP
ncbi:hypothetical protein [Intrasporangium sp. DVR]|uniref:hypothetical protein n=1 Tax=Intrasporangium sp. DVR TaxID=3127867 RepID=UPI00333EF1B0